VGKVKYKSDDVELLLPSFKPVIMELMLRMAARGFTCVPFDTVRTSEEAARNARRGRGIENSIHIYGAACDLICAEHGWSCGTQRPRCGFFQALGAEAEGLGLLWGGRFKRVDLPHVQGISIKQQETMRKLGSGPESVDARDKLVRTFLKAGSAQAAKI
jgi:hypothetical protein